MAQDSSPATGSSLKMLVYWAIVAVPLTWGVYKTIIKSQPLFAGTTTAVSASPTPTPTVATPAPLATAAPEASPVASMAPVGT